MHTLFSSSGVALHRHSFFCGWPTPSSKNPWKGQLHMMRLKALTFNVGELKNPQKSAAEKAIAICWVEHIIGDLHQPLHAASLYSPEFPKGDQGEMPRALATRRIPTVQPSCILSGILCRAIFTQRNWTATKLRDCTTTQNIPVTR